MNNRIIFGPFEAYAYHDYPNHPRRSPFYCGVWVGPVCLEVRLSPDSVLRPVSRWGK